MEVVKAINNNGVRAFITRSGIIVNQGVRKIKSGSEFDHLIDVSGVKFTSSFIEGGVSDTISQMTKIIKKHHGQVGDLAHYLKKDTVLATCESIWKFVFNHIQYKRDKQGIEQLSTPARIWLNRNTPNTPTDCDDHSIFVGSLLYCLNIPFTIRIAGYDNNTFSHVYIIANNDICIDTVLHRFNCEANYTSKKDTKMQIETLAGLQGWGKSDPVGELVESVRTYENEVRGLGDFQTNYKQEEAALRSFGVKQLEIAIREYDNDPVSFHTIGFMPDYWKHARAVLHEMKNGSLEGIIVKLSDGREYESNQMRTVNGFHVSGGIGMFGALHGLFKKIKKGIKKVAKKVVKPVAKVVKKVAKPVVKVAKAAVKVVAKINPLFILIRGGMQLAVKTNFSHLALKMGFAMLTEAQAKSIGCDKEQWNKSKSAYSAFIKKYKFFGGSESNLRKTLSKAWHDAATKEGYQTVALNTINGLSGDIEIEMGALGVVPAVAAAPAATGLIAKAMSFLKPILSLLGSFNLGKLFKKAKEKHIENLKERLDKATTPEEKAKLQEKIAKSENNLLILNKQIDENSKQIPTPDQQPIVEQTLNPDNGSLIDSTTKTASVNKYMMAGLILVAGGLLWSSNKNGEKEEKPVQNTGSKNRKPARKVNNKSKN